MSIAWNEPDLTESSRPSWKVPAGAYGFSTFIHVLLLGLLSIFTFVDNPFTGNHGLLMNWNSKLSEDIFEPEAVQPQEYQPRSGGSQTSTVALLTSDNESKIAAPELREASLLSVTNDEWSTSHMADYVGTLSTFGKGGHGKGEGTGDGKGDGFFGKPGNASSFVFVLDRSRSMNKPHIYSGNLTRFQRLKLELIQFIDGLSPEQKFYVIFFDEQAHPMPANGLVEATKENKEAFLKWLSKVTADGSTDPRAAVKMAMYLKPDQIYFLSDGEIMDFFRLQLMEMPAGEWKLNTYAFGEGSERFMRVFAKKHGGDYIFIP